MDRRSFLGNLLATAIIAALPKELVQAARKYPNLNVKPITITLDRAYFCHGDIIRMSNNKDYIFIMDEEGKATLKSLNSEDALTINVKWIEEMPFSYREPLKPVRMANAYIEK